MEESAPTIAFSDWFKWQDVDQIPCGKERGVYIIGRFKNVPVGPADPCAEEILYIGETHGQKKQIRKRLETFFKAAQTGEGLHKHSGGNRFNKLCRGNLEDVYAAGFAPVLANEEHLEPYIYLIERQLIWAYIVRWGKKPLCKGK